MFLFSLCSLLVSSSVSFVDPYLSLVVSMFFADSWFVSLHTDDPTTRLLPMESRRCFSLTGSGIYGGVPHALLLVVITFRRCASPRLARHLTGISVVDQKIYLPHLPPAPPSETISLLLLHLSPHPENFIFNRAPSFRLRCTVAPPAWRKARTSFIKEAICSRILYSPPSDDLRILTDEHSISGDYRSAPAPSPTLDLLSVLGLKPLLWVRPIMKTELFITYVNPTVKKPTVFNFVQSPNSKVLRCGLPPHFPPFVSIPCLLLSNVVMEMEKITVSLHLSQKFKVFDVCEIHIVSSKIHFGLRAFYFHGYSASSRYSSGSSALSQTHLLGCISVDFDYCKLFGAVVSGIQVKNIQGFLSLSKPLPLTFLSYVLLHHLCCSSYRRVYLRFLSSYRRALLRL